MAVSKARFEHCHLYVTEKRYGGCIIRITKANGSEQMDFNEGDRNQIVMQVLDSLGLEGWELVTISNKTLGDHYFMKRRIEN